MNNSDTSHYENVPFEVPESWCWGNIMEVLVKLTDGTHHSPKNYPKGNYKYITAKNIKNEGVVLDGVTYVDDETHHEIFSRCNPEYGDILYIKDGATTGVVAINNLEEEFSLLSSVALLKPSKLISKKYLFYYLQSSYCYESVRSSMKGVGITRITLKQIADWEVPIPPIEEQHRIVEYIDSLFAQIDLIAKDTATLNLFLEKYKHGILNLAIAGKLVPQDPSDEPAVKLLTRINPGYKPCDNRHYANVPFSLPDTWLWASGKDLFLPMKNCKPSGEYFKYIDIDSIDNQDCVVKCPKVLPVTAAPSRATRCTKVGDILFSMVRPYLKNIAMITESDCIASTGFYVCSPNKALLSKYCYYLMISPYVINGLSQFMKGDNSPSINNVHISDWLYPLPPLNEQKRIVKKVDEVFRHLDSIVTEL